MTLKQRISPKTLNMLMHKHIYDKEIAAAKAANPEPKIKSDRYSRAINIHDISIPVQYVQDWVTDKDEKLALSRSTGWLTGKMPPNILEEIKNDPKWKDIILRIWEVSGILLKEASLPQPNQKYGANYSKYTRMGLPATIDEDLCRELRSLIAPYRKKYNIDKTGRQLGNVSHWAR
jgi:hypothetical protein